MADTTTLLIDDFGRDDGRSASGALWRGFSDQVMGGVSQEQVTFEVIAGRRCLRLRGRVRLDNNGGFVQMALPLDAGGQPLDAGGFRGLRLMVWGNGERYYVHLRSPDAGRPGSSTVRASRHHPAGPRWNCPSPPSRPRRSRYRSTSGGSRGSASSPPAPPLTPTWRSAGLNSTPEADKHARGQVWRAPVLTASDASDARQRHRESMPSAPGRRSRNPIEGQQLGLTQQQHAALPQATRSRDICRHQGLCDAAPLLLRMHRER